MDEISEDLRSGRAEDGLRDGILELPPTITRERRLHAKAHDYWRSLRSGRPLPSVCDLDPACLADCAGQTVLVEVRGPAVPPAYRFIGSALAAEAGIDPEDMGLEHMPAGTLLGEIARRLPAVVSAARPLSFEAEYVGRDGMPTMYRGVLLPVAAEGQDVRFVYGVVNWKTIATGDLGSDIRAAVTSAFRTPPAPPAESAWGVVADPVAVLPPVSAEQRLAAGQTWAALAAGGGVHGEAGLHKAASAVFDLLCDGHDSVDLPASEPAGLVRTILGLQAPRRVQRQLLAAVAWGRRLRLGLGQLATLLAATPGGFDAIAGAERAARREDRVGRQEPPPSNRMRLAPFEEVVEPSASGWMRRAG